MSNDRAQANCTGHASLQGPDASGVRTSMETARYVVRAIIAQAWRRADPPPMGSLRSERELETGRQRYAGGELRHFFGSPGFCLADGVVDGRSNKVF